MKNEITERSALFWNMTACSCFAAAFVAGVVGSLLTTTWIVNGQLHPWLRDLGLVLLVVTMPSIIMGGHCLDLGEREDAKHDSEHRKSAQQPKPLHVIALIGAILSFYLFSAST